MPSITDSAASAASAALSSSGTTSTSRSTVLVTTLLLLVGRWRRRCRRCLRCRSPLAPPPPGCPSPGWSAASCVPAGSAPSPPPPPPVARRPAVVAGGDSELRRVCRRFGAAAGSPGSVTLPSPRTGSTPSLSGSVRAGGRPGPGSTPVSVGGSITPGVEFGSGAGSSTSGPGRRGRPPCCLRSAESCPRCRCRPAASPGRSCRRSPLSPPLVESSPRGLVARLRAGALVAPGTPSPGTPGGARLRSARVGGRLGLRARLLRRAAAAGRRRRRHGRPAASRARHRPAGVPSPPPRTGSSTGVVVACALGSPPSLASALDSGVFDPPASSTIAIAKKRATAVPARAAKTRA